jgi:hypothetical protein
MLTKEQLENLRKSAEQRTEEAKQKRKNGSYAPTIYTPDGVSYVRFYADSEGEVVRTLQMHKAKVGKKGTLRSLCTGDAKCCPICRKLEYWTTKFPGMGTAWMLKSREISIAYTIFFSASDTDNKYLMLEEPMLLMGDYRLADELSEKIQTMPDDEFQKMLNPEVPHSLFELKSKRKSSGKGTNFSLGHHWDKKAMEPLPEHLPPLSQCIYPQGQAPDPTEQESFIKAIDAAFEGYQQRSELEPAEVGQKSPESEPAPPALHQVRTEPKPPQQETPPSDSHLHPSSEKCFGKYPVEKNAECLMCNDETECIEKTNSKPRLSPSGTDCFGQHPTEESAECYLCDHEPECALETEARLKA